LVPALVSGAGSSSGRRTALLPSSVVDEKDNDANEGGSGAGAVIAAIDDGSPSTLFNRLPPAEVRSSTTIMESARVAE